MISYRQKKLERNIKKPVKSKVLKFVNFGEKGRKASVEGSGLLVTTTDWQMRVELRQRMEFPTEIAVTNRDPTCCVAIWSASTKQTILILLELTVPLEDRLEDEY